ncbi:hypothetical protein TA3x_000394 [Tundrisphaera sp. TA3]|uniref:hypothetical protein n=1 Tax=Tundrisphaera sp. TA3 TaxID=3435775 RepID=UPI003EBA52C5
MPDEVLAEMVKKAMQEMFFTRREKKGESWNSRTEVFPSWFEDEVAASLKRRVLEEIETAVSAKREEIREVAVKLVTEKLPDTIVSALLAVISQVSLGNSYNIQTQILGMLREKGIQL